MFFVEDLLTETCELKRDPKERETEEATKALSKWQNENASKVESLMSFN